MRQSVLIASLLFVITCVTPRVMAATAATPDPTGAWKRADGTAAVRIAPCGTDLCATNTWIKDTSNGEDVGDRLVMRVTPRSGNVLSGTAYDAKRDKTYAITLDVGPTQLTTRGCVAFGLLCRSVSWSRQPEPAPQPN